MTNSKHARTVKKRLACSGTPAPTLAPDKGDKDSPKSDALSTFELKCSTTFVRNLLEVE